MEGMKHSELTTEQVFYRFLQKWLLRMSFDSWLTFELWPYFSYVACIVSITAKSGLKGQSWVVSQMTFADNYFTKPVAHHHFTSWFKATFSPLRALSSSKRVDQTIVSLTKHWWTKLCLEIKIDFILQLLHDAQHHKVHPVWTHLAQLGLSHMNTFSPAEQIVQYIWV